MSSDPFYNPKLDVKRNREIRAFAPREPNDAIEQKKIPNIEAFKEVDTLVERAKEIVEDLEKEGGRFSIPIDLEENETRAAHLRLGGDGEVINFQQFKNAINDLSRARGDIIALRTGVTDYGTARHKDKSSLKRHSKNLGFDPAFSAIASFGSQAVILWALNALIGMFHSGDHSGIASGKLPPGTEAGEVIKEMIQSLIFQKFISGMTDAALEKMLEKDDIIPSNIGVSASSLIKMAGPPPKSESFELFKASMRDSDNKLIKDYSISYCSRNIGEGFESWWAYLTARDTHEGALRMQKSGEVYADQGVNPSDLTAGSVGNKVAAENKNLDLLSVALGRSLGADDACCLVRFLSGFSIGRLKNIKRLIEMAIAVIEAQAGEAFKWYMKLSNHPLSVVSNEIMRSVDAIFDEIVDDVLDGFDFDEDTAAILSACTPIKELSESIISVLENLRNRLYDIMNLVNQEVTEGAKALSKGWQDVGGIRRSKELLKSINDLISFSDEYEKLEEGELVSISGSLIDYMYTHNVPGAKEVESAKELTDDILKWCRKIGNVDGIKELVS